jgi:hypothetical protein
MSSFFDLLPIEVRDRVFDFYGMTEYWKHRFSMDVLTEINRGWRWVGYECDLHPFDAGRCWCPAVQPCSECFNSGWECHEGLHEDWIYVSYDQVIETGTNWAIRQQPYLPWQIFSYLAEDAAREERETMLHLELMSELYHRNNNGTVWEHLVKERAIEHHYGGYSTSESGESDDMSDYEDWYGIEQEIQW